MTNPLRPQPGHPGTYRHSGLSCPGCGAYADAITNSEPGGPTADDGDAAICVHCGVVSILVVGPLGVAYRRPDPAELAEVMAQHGHLIHDRRGVLARNLRPS